MVSFSISLLNFIKKLINCFQSRLHFDIQVVLLLDKDASHLPGSHLPEVSDGVVVPLDGVQPRVEGEEGGGQQTLVLNAIVQFVRLCHSKALSRQSAMLFLQSLELGLTTLSHAGECVPPPLLVPGGHSTRLRERGWG
jgi:hypothetical protein